MRGPTTRRAVLAGALAWAVAQAAPAAEAAQRIRLVRSYKAAAAQAQKAKKLMMVDFSTSW